MKTKFLVKPMRKLPEDLPTIADRIEYVRCIFGYPVLKFAKKVGTMKASIENILTGNKNPSLKILDGLCTVFQVSKEWVILGSGKPPVVKPDSELIYTEGSKGQKNMTDEELEEALEFGQRVKEIRMDKNMSQAVFAATLGQLTDSLGRVEQGRNRVTLLLVKRVAKAHGATLEWLVWGTGAKYGFKQMR